MFRGLKNAVKGGIGVVSEKGQDLAGSVVGDPDLGTSSLKTKLKEGAKSTLKGSSQFVEQGTENFTETVGSERVEGSKELAKDVVHNAKHYGAFGENFLGYSDPTKDLRKAVKAKEKAAKKAKKEKKKKGGKTEDLFDPENLAKYKAELEEKRRLAAEASPGPVVEVEAVKSGQSSPEKSGSPVFEARRASVNSWGFQKAESPDFEFESPSPSKEKVEKEEKKAEEWKKVDNWKDQLNALSSGVDDLLKEKREKLEEIKVDSYYQRKKTQDEIDEENKIARPKTLVGKRKKKWVDLDQDEFEEYEGEIPIVLSDGDDDVEEEEEEEKVETKEPTPEEEVQRETDEEKDEEGEKKEEDKNEEEEDIFNTQFVNETLAVLDVKLAEIPDSPEEKEDDIFDTKYADVIVEKAKQEREKVEKAESNRIKFGCIANAADVLAGKAATVDPSNAEHAVKAGGGRRQELGGRSRRRPRPGDRPVVDEAKEAEAIKDITNTVHIKESQDTNGAEVDGSVEAPAESSIEETDKAESQKLSDEDFEVIQSGEGEQDKEKTPVVEEEEEEEEDPFDAAFDEIAKESVAKAEEKSNLARLEEDLFNDDLFDTTAADDVLNLASLTKVKEKQEKEEVVLDDFDDKDPFDTSAYEHLTKDLEEDLEFESLATREISNEVKDLASVATDLGPDDPFEVVDKQAKAQKFGDEEGGWGAFDTAVVRKKPPRPPPRRPPPPRPPRPSESKETPQVQVDYASGTNTGRNTPSVIIKAPSSESIKSWNVNQAETLILKCNIEAIEASALEDDDEDDPFDTKQFEGIVAELKGKEEDPFDTSAASKLGPSEIKELEKDDKEDPFDTEFAEKVVPDKGDPFSTEHVPEDDFDPFDTTVADSVIPVRAPTIDQKTTVSIEDNDFDPEASFKTKKAPPPAPPKPKTPPKEDDPFFAFQEPKKKEEPRAPVIPVRKPVYNKYARTRPKTLQEKQAEQAAAEAERQRQLELERKANESSDDDFDFDPRAKTPSPVKEVPKTPESPDPFDTDGIDPFDTSVVG